MSLRDENLRIALLTTIAAAIEEELKGQRTTHLQSLLEEFTEKGSKNFDVTLEPGGDSLGQLILPVPADTFVVDDVALLAWAKKNAPGMVQHTVVPPMPEQEFDEVLPASLAALKKRAVYDKKTKQVMDGNQVVEGLTFKPGGKPKSFTVKLNADGKETLLTAWRSGELTEIAGGTTLPEIGQETPPWE